MNKELKKIPKPSSGSGSEYVAEYNGTWPYFQSLLFLRPVLNPRATEGNVSQWMELPDDISEAFNFDIADTSISVVDVPSPSISHKRKHDADISSPSSSRRRKNDMEAFVQIEEERLLLDKKKLEVFCQAEESSKDDDLQFFLSLLPYMRTMPAAQKLRTRMKILALVTAQFTAEDEDVSIIETDAEV